MKAAIGKLSVPPDLREHVLRSGVQVLQLDAETVSRWRPAEASS